MLEDRERVPDSGVRVVDYGIRGMHLAYDLLDGWDALVLVDAIPGEGSPGTVHVFEADHATLAAAAALDAHSMDPAAVFASLAALGGTPPRTVVVGCEVDSVEEGMGLSGSVSGSMAAATAAVRNVVAALQTELADSTGRN